MNFMYLYAACLLIGSFYALLSAIFGWHGFDHGDIGGGHLGGHVDVGGHGADAAGHSGHVGHGDADQTDGGPSPLSPTVIASAITAFGASGLVCSYFSHLAFWMVLLISALVGFGVAVVIFNGFIKVLYNQQSNTMFSRDSLPGTAATVIVTIPANGMGEVAYYTAGSRYTASAKSLEGCEIKWNEKVVIVKVEGNLVYVSKAIELDDDEQAGAPD